MTRVAVVGARDHRALAQVHRRVHALPEGVTVVSGDADGVDWVTRLAAQQRGQPYEGHAPDYAAHGDRAPLERNTTIATTVDEVDAFPWPGCRGTWDTVRKAQARGIPVRVHEPEAPALLVFSARVTYAGRGALRITRYEADEAGAGDAFAPSKKLLGWALAERERAARMRSEAADLAGQQMLLGEVEATALSRTRRAEELRAEAERIEATMWPAYSKAYKAEMRISCGLTRGSAAWARRPPDDRLLHEEAWDRGARPRPQAWGRLLEMGFVVVTCFCVDREHCHRAILRSEILPALGAVDGGEVPTR